MLYDGGKSALTRRVFVGRLAASTAALLAATAGRARASSARAASKLPDAGGAGGAQRSFAPGASKTLAGTQGGGGSLSAPPPWELLHPLATGATVAPGWRLAELSGVADGSCVVTLRNSSGRTYRVHLCRNDGQPNGLVYTDRFDLVVMNGGQGDQRTDEGLAQTVAALAHVLAANEADPRRAAVLSALLPHGQRVQRFAGAATLL